MSLNNIGLIEQIKNLSLTIEFFMLSLFDSNWKTGSLHSNEIRSLNPNHTEQKQSLLVA